MLFTGRNIKITSVILLLASVLFSSLLIPFIFAQSVTTIRKIAAYILDIGHVFLNLCMYAFIIIIFIDAVVYGNINIESVLIANILILAYITGFFWFKRCIGSMTFQKLLNLDSYSFLDPWSRFSSKPIFNNENNGYSIGWISKYKYVTPLFIILDVVVLVCYMIKGKKALY
jgi:hypothetical protein